MAGTKGRSGGRNRKSDEQKKLEGTYRPDRANEDMPDYDSDAIVMPAELLTEAEQSYWAHYAPMLLRSKVMTEADVMSLVALCRENALYDKAVLNCEAVGEVYLNTQGNPAKHPWVQIRSQALSACTRLWGLFGLTPADRPRVKVVKEAGETAGQAEGNKFAGLRAVK